MRTALGCVLAGLLVAVAGAAAQDKDKGEKIDPKKLVGKWLPAKEDLPPGAKVVVEFTKDNKLAVEIDVAGEKSKAEGTYKLEGNKLSLVLKAEGKEKTDTMTVLKLTDDELVTKEEGKEKPDTLTRVKEKK